MLIDEKLAELFGIFLGDGCISINSRYSELAICGDINEEREYYDKWVVPLFNEKITKVILNKEIIAKDYPKSGVHGFYTFNKKVVDFFLEAGFIQGKKTYAIIPKNILENKKIYAPFLRGIFDTDGSIFFQKNNSIKVSKHKFPRIKLGSTSEKLIKQLKMMMESLGYSPSIPQAYRGKRDLHPMHYIEICKRKEVHKWINEIGFSSSKHLTKISVWKKLGYCPPNTTIEQRKTILNN